MKKFLAIALIAVVAVAAVFANGSSESASSEVKIGFIGPLTGDYANYGTLCRQAVEMAIDECNAKGGIDGMTVKLIAEDSEGDPNKAYAAMEKLANTDKVSAVIGPVLTGEAFSVGPIACELGVLSVTPSASHKDVTNQGDYIFRTTPSDGLQGEVAGKYWYQILGYRKLAVLYAKNDYSQGLYEGMKESFEADGGSIVAVETFMVGDKDFKTQLTKLKLSTSQTTQQKWLRFSSRLHSLASTSHSSQVTDSSAKKSISLPASIQMVLSTQLLLSWRKHHLSRNSEMHTQLSGASVQTPSQQTAMMLQTSFFPSSMKLEQTERLSETVLQQLRITKV